MNFWVANKVVFYGEPKDLSLLKENEDIFVLINKKYPMINAVWNEYTCVFKNASVLDNVHCIERLCTKFNLSARVKFWRDFEYNSDYALCGCVVINTKTENPIQYNSRVIRRYEKTEVKKAIKDFDLEGVSPKQ